MCLIIANLDGRSIPDEFIVNAQRRNSDGFGIMYATKTGELKVTRGLFDAEKIISIVRRISAAKLPYTAHFRMATHGITHASNCHPFPVSDELGGIGVAHNGGFGSPFTSDYVKSDTFMFAEDVKANLKQSLLSAGDLFDESQKELNVFYGREFSGWNKVVFMNGQGKFNIVNEKGGCWIGGVWYSNDYSVGGDTCVRRNNLTKVERTSVLHNKEALSLVLNDEIEIADEDFIMDEDFSFDPDDSPTEEELIGFIREEDDEVFHPFAQADGYSGKRSSQTNEKRFYHLGVEYDLNDEADCVAVEDLLDTADIDELIAEAKTDDSDDEEDWNRFKREYEELQNRKLLPAVSNSTARDAIVLAETVKPKEPVKETAKDTIITTTPSGQTTMPYKYSKESTSFYDHYGHYGHNGYYTGTSKKNDAVDDIVDALLQA